MAKYIKREDAINCARKIALFYGTEYESEEELMDKAQADMEQEPSINIVHCKDCRYYNTGNCFLIHGTMKRDMFDNDYCSLGERKEQEHD